METPFPFDAVVVFSVMSLMLLIGMLLRASVKFLQNYLIPSCFIGGALGLILLSSGLIKLPASLLETFAYHLFIISFISLGLTTSESNKGKPRAASPIKGALWIGISTGAVMAMQALIGFLFVFLLNRAGFSLNPLFSFLAPLGFAQGPGQALSMGKVWEEFGFAHAGTLGLSFAAFGFAFAFFVGVPLVNWGIRKGFTATTAKRLSPELLKGIMLKSTKKEAAGELTTHSANIDTMAFHAALVGLVYLLSYLLVAGIGKLISEDVAKSLWGFFFFLGLVVALLVKYLMGRLGLSHLLDPGTQRRITGFSVDYLIVSTIMAIEAVIVLEYIVPIVLTSLATGIATTIVVFYLGRRTWGYSFERTIGYYGIATGTAPTGLLLLRIADPDLETPVALEIGIQAIFAAPFVFGYMLLMNGPLWWGWSVQMVLVIFTAVMVLALVLLKLLKFIGPRQF